MICIIQYFCLLTTTIAVKVNVEADVAIGPKYAYNIKGSYGAEIPNFRVKLSDKKKNKDLFELVHSSKTSEDGIDSSTEDFSETFHRKRKKTHKVIQRAKLGKETTTQKKHFRHHDRHETRHTTYEHKALKYTTNKYKKTRHNNRKSTKNIMSDRSQLSYENYSLFQNGKDKISKDVRYNNLKQRGVQSLKELTHTTDNANSTPDLKHLRTIQPSSLIDIFEELKILTNKAIESLNGQMDDTRGNLNNGVVFSNDTHVTMLKSKMMDKQNGRNIPGFDEWLEEVIKNRTSKVIDEIKDKFGSQLSANITKFNDKINNLTIKVIVNNATHMLIQNASVLEWIKLKSISKTSLDHAKKIKMHNGKYVFRYNNTHNVTVTQVTKKPPLIKIEYKNLKNNKIEAKQLINGITIKEMCTTMDIILIKDAVTNEWIKINEIIEGGRNFLKNDENNFKNNYDNNNYFTQKYVFLNKTHEIVAVQVNDTPPVIDIKFKDKKHNKSVFKTKDVTQYRTNRKHKKNENKESKIAIKWEPYWTDLNYRVERDEQVDAFTKHILKDTLKLLNNVKNNIKEYQWKKQINRVAKQYEEKFNEFLRTTRHQKIKTRLGPQKVVLNAIDMSKLIVNRLLNAAIHELDKKGSLRSGGDANTIYNEINKEIESKRNRACTNLGICINEKGFTYYIVLIMNTILSLNDDKYQEVLDATIDAIENTDFTKTLSKSGDRELKKVFNNFQQHDIKIQKGIITIIRNLLFSRNMPLVIHKDSTTDKSKVNKTLAFLEIVNTLDKYQGNKEWERIERDINDYSHNDLGIDIRDTMARFVTQIKDALDHKSHSRDIIRANIKTVLT